MVKIEERQQRPTNPVEASPTRLSALTEVVDASTLQSTGLDRGRPCSELDLLITSDRIAPAQGIATGLVVSAMLWAAIAVSTWQSLR